MTWRTARNAPISKALVEQHEDLLTIHIFQFELATMIRVFCDPEVDIKAELVTQQLGNFRPVTFSFPVMKDPMG